MSTEPIYLSAEEIHEITGLSQPKRQIGWLVANGFMVKTRADGTPLVARSHFIKVMGGDPGGRTGTSKDDTPDFSSLSA